MRSVIMFHGIQDDDSALTVSRSEFESILRSVRDNGYSIEALDEVLAARPTDKVVALTFDDGFESVNLAAEVLADAKAPATIFIVTGWVGKTDSWPGQKHARNPYQLLTWSQLKALQAAGWDVQAHSHSHPDLRQLPDKYVIKELETCKACLRDRLGVDATVFAYPYGYVNGRVYDIVKSRFEAAVTTMLSNVPKGFDRYLVPRIDGHFLWPKPVHYYFGRRRFRAYLKARQHLRRLGAHPGEPNVEEWIHV